LLRPFVKIEPNSSRETQVPARSTIEMVSAVFTITYKMNGEVSTTLENIPLSQVYDFAVHHEALMDIEGSRWHVLVKNVAELEMFNMLVGDKMMISYQDPPQNPELDTEEVFVSRTA